MDNVDVLLNDLDSLITSYYGYVRVLKEVATDKDVSNCEVVFRYIETTSEYLDNLSNVSLLLIGRDIYGTSSSRRPLFLPGKKRNIEDAINGESLRKLDVKYDNLRKSVKYLNNNLFVDVTCLNDILKNPLGLIDV